jgi:single-strand DNA-binding protein
VSDNQVMITGNVVTPPSLRCTRDGTLVTGFRIASTPRRLDRASGQWKDGETLFLSVSCWRSLAENVATSLTKGDAVLVCGRLVSRSYDTSAGERRTSIEIEATSVGPDLTRGVARLARIARSPGRPEESPADAPDPAGAEDVGEEEAVPAA